MARPRARLVPVALFTFVCDTKDHRDDEKYIKKYFTTKRPTVYAGDFRAGYPRSRLAAAS